ncbi:MAG TPA: DUF2752 domain-containing protein [Planctomycetes bacterium]|nr:DUF2752 domain-containing protein [Planctomycetota bacterium]
MQTLPGTDAHPRRAATAMMAGSSCRDELLRRHHRMMLALSAAVVVLAATLHVRPDGRVALCFLPRLPLPPTCFSRIVLGTSCPACGLTRSFVHLAHGHVQAAWQAHRLGWLMALAVLLQFPYRTVALASRNPRPLGTRLPQFFGWGLIALLVLNWLAGVFG